MRKMLKSDKRPPIHPGEILKETLEELGISMNRLAQEICVPANRISARPFRLPTGRAPKRRPALVLSPAAFNGYGAPGSIPGPRIAF